jgi:hypothetical protein
VLAVTPFHVEHAAPGESPSHPSPSSRTGALRLPPSLFHVERASPGRCSRAPHVQGLHSGQMHGGASRPSRSPARAPHQPCSESVGPGGCNPAVPSPSRSDVPRGTARKARSVLARGEQGRRFVRSEHSPRVRSSPRASRAPVLLRAHEALRGTVPPRGVHRLRSGPRAPAVPLVHRKGVIASAPFSGPPPAPPRPGWSHPVEREVNRRRSSERGSRNPGPLPAPAAHSPDRVHQEGDAELQPRTLAPPAAAPPASSRHPPPAPTPARSCVSCPSAPCPPSPASPAPRTLPTTARSSAGPTIGSHAS